MTLFPDLPQAREQTASMRQIVVGIDPGKAGGLVIIDAAGRLLEAHRSEKDFVADKNYQTAAMASVLRPLFDLRSIGTSVLVVLERQHAMPDFSKRKGSDEEPRKQGNTSIFATGYGFGLWQGIVAGIGLPLELVSAQSWQAQILRGVPGNNTKARAAQVAQNRIPSLPLIPPRGSKPHGGIADAACLALYGLTRVAQEVPRG